MAERKEGQCELCRRDWQPANYGSPRKCAFEGETFSSSNWNCGLANRIRKAMYDDEHEGHALRYRNDVGVGSVGALVVEVPSSAPDADHGFDHEFCGLLVADWYKDRGALDGLKWGLEITGLDGPEVTRAQAMAIAAWLDSREAARERWDQEQAERQAERQKSPQSPAFNFAAFLAGPAAAGDGGET